MATHSIILAWRIPWAEEPAGCSPWDHKESDPTEVTSHAAHCVPNSWPVLLCSPSLHSVNSGYLLGIIQDVNVQPGSFQAVESPRDPSISFTAGWNPVVWP